ncbi:hypothetical protein LPJ63_003265, partial [Coemansia sp. RSA 2711]
YATGYSFIGMGLFSFFKREENYEEILSSLEQDMRQAEKQRALAAERMEWWAHNWLFYTGVGWLAYAVGFALYVWPERHDTQASGFLLHATLVATVPLAVYYGNRAIRTLWHRVIGRHDARIARLQGELRERLDELKKKTAYDSTKNLIDRFSAGETAPADAEARGPAGRLRQQEAKNRRRTMPNFGTPATQAGGKASAPDTSPLAARSMQMRGQRQTLQQQQPRQAPLGAPRQIDAGPAPNPGESGVVRVAPAEPNGAGSRPWLDKLVDQLVGDVGSDRDKYALICRHCYAHNGLVLEEEIRDIQYTCPRCGRFNPSMRALGAGQQSAIAAPSKQPAAAVTAAAPALSTSAENADVDSSHAETDHESQSDSHDNSDGDDAYTPLSTPVAQTRQLRSTPSKASVTEPDEPPAHQPPAKSKPTPRKRKPGAAKSKRT